MVKVTKLNREEIYVNADLIEIIEAQPDTAIILQGGKRILVRDPVESVVKNIIRYKNLVHTSIAVRQQSGQTPAKGS